MPLSQHSYPKETVVCSHGAELRQRVRAAAGAAGDDEDSSRWGSRHGEHAAPQTSGVAWLAALSGAASAHGAAEARQRGVLRWIWDAGLPSSIWVSVFVSYSLTSVDAAVRETLAFALADPDEVIKYRWAVLVIQVTLSVASTILMVHYTKKWHTEEDREAAREVDQTGAVDVDRPLVPRAAARGGPAAAAAPLSQPDESDPRSSVETLLLSSPLDDRAPPTHRSNARDFLRKYGILIVSAMWLWVASSAFAVSSETIDRWTSEDDVNVWRVGALWFRALVFLASAMTIVFTTVNLSVVFYVWSLIIAICVAMAVFYVLA